VSKAAADGIDHGTCGAVAAGALDLTPRVTSVAIDEVAVITRLAGLGDAVATQFNDAVAVATVAGGDVAVIAFLASANFNHAVAAELAPQRGTSLPADPVEHTISCKRVLARGPVAARPNFAAVVKAVAVRIP
jgi:hypothetical protein